MRWKLLRRRLSVSAPKVIVRSHMPWPLRWAVVAIAFGFSAALALWAFEFGKEIAGLDRGAKAELMALRAELTALKAEREQTLTVANTADSLLKAERVAQDRLAKQLSAMESENLSLKADLGFFERLVPATSEEISVRGLQAQLQEPGQLRFQILVMQSGKAAAEFNGRYELQLSGTLDGKPWVHGQPGGAQPVKVQYRARIEGLVQYPPQAVVKAAQVKLFDQQGRVRSTQSVKL